jgi:hypothetical protein
MVLLFCILTALSRNFIYSKQFFWFGSDALETKSLSSYLKGEKSTETGHHNASWASHTGKGLLFFGDKSTPSGVINLVWLQPRPACENMTNRCGCRPKPLSQQPMAPTSSTSPPRATSTHSRPPPRLIVTPGLRS